MKRQLLTAVWMTLATTVLLGIVYPLAVTGAAQLLFHDKANGQLLHRNGQLIGSRILGQQFSGPGYFHPRPSAAGDGYDAANSGGTNYAATNARLVERVRANVAGLQRENPDTPVPADLVMASASGLDPEISIAAAEFQVPRVARERHMTTESLAALVRSCTRNRQLGFLGEPGVNVLQLNLALDAGAAQCGR
ncbi:MAG TPA: potassium-transporting ATPase subunit KdpC [Terriglobales bacterium]|nr:potassium-transporting ATPase subunit KdpC [Terriglobales bacterium]